MRVNVIAAKIALLFDRVPRSGRLDLLSTCCMSKCIDNVIDEIEVRMHGNDYTPTLDR